MPAALPPGLQPPMTAAQPALTWLSLLNAFDLRHRGESVRIPLPAQRLLAYLALQRYPVQRRSVAAALWTDHDDRTAGARLRSTLWRLPALEGRRLVRADAGRMQLGTHVEVDVRVAEDDDRADELELSHLCGDMLTDWEEPWVAAERERFRQMRLHRLEQMSDRARREGRFSQALQAALAAVAAEPLRESAHRRVMQLHLAEDNPAEALRQYDLVRRLLRDELGLAPAARTRAVVAALLGRPLDGGPRRPGAE
jgi:DNA-binding SARP family transcriptional activator